MEAEGSARRGAFSRRALLAGCVLLAAFLAGFAPQYRAAASARQDLRSAQDELARLRREAARSRLRDLAALLLYEVAQRNFGTAAQHSTALFDALQEEIAASGSESPEQLRQALAARDAVTAGLAAADPAVQAQVIGVFRLIFDTTRRL